MSHHASLPWLTIALSLSLASPLAACPDDDGGGGATDTAADTVADAADTSGVADTTPPVVYDKPSYFPASGDDADEALPLAGLEGAVRVVYDDRGVPHIFGDARTDVFRAQGFVTARDRIFQMHTLRMAASGRLAEYAGAGSLSGDMYLRLVKLRHTAEAMAADTETSDPELYEAIVAFADGVNQYLARLKAGLETGPPEVNIFGADIIHPWTVADTMTVVRLQTWDLGFDDDRDLSILEHALALRERFDGTAREGLERDWLNHEPVWEVAAHEPDGGAAQTGAFDVAATLDDAFFQRLDSRAVRQLRAPLEKLADIPHHAFRGPDFGSNNWVVSGAHTASGRPIVANDTHLALRNPAVFYQVHVSNTLAGGDLNANGVNFAGAPGIVLGHNDHAAWGGTVFGGDVTDVYIETLDATGSRVMYDGAEVDLVERVETFTFNLPGGAETCADAAPDWIANLAHSETLTSGRCNLTVTFLEVPHHGPIIPWSFREDADGAKTAASWRWTGFEPTSDLSAVYDLNAIAGVDDFKAALNQFGVGAQNWVGGFSDGDIAWYPSHLMPIRKHIAAGDTTHPPFFPMPGDTSDTNWDGFVPRDQLPQAVNPAKGWIATANGDPTGVTFDNDPFNDGPYIGFTGWTSGFRIGRIDERLTALVAEGDLTIADMKALQGDHQSNLGKTLNASLIAAIQDAKGGADAAASALVDDQVDRALAVLEQWQGLGWEAASGVGAEPTSDAKKASVATSIFNAWLVFALKNALGDEGLDDGGSHTDARIFARMVLAPETMATWDETLGDTVLWDDADTEDVTETRTYVMVKSLVDALEFLAATDKVGPSQAGGFGTDDMDAWRWGALHTVKLAHNVSSAFDIPPPSELPDGFPRPCDNFCVDASHPGTSDTRFTFSSGPAIRNVFELLDTTEFHGVIPGGQSEDALSPHYADGMALWVDNLAPEVPFAAADVIAAREKIVDLVPPE